MTGLEVLKKTLFTEHARTHTHTHKHSELPTSEITFLKQCQLLGITPHDKTNGGHATNYSKKKANFKFKKKVPKMKIHSTASTSPLYCSCL
jgi:hypothetical protein